MNIRFISAAFWACLFLSSGNAVADPLSVGSAPSTSQTIRRDSVEKFAKASLVETEAQPQLVSSHSSYERLRAALALEADNGTSSTSPSDLGLMLLLVAGLAVLRISRKQNSLRHSSVLS